MPIGQINRFTNKQTEIMGSREASLFPKYRPAIPNGLLVGNEKFER
jgi:hypothetical protein